VSSDSFKAALQAARNELGRLARQREQIDQRMIQLVKIVESLLPLVDSDNAVESDSLTATVSALVGNDALVDQEEGITEAIKRVFELFGTASTAAGISPMSLTPLEVREWLIKLGSDLSKYPNPMATIHSILKRLVDQTWLVRVEKDGKPAYQRGMFGRYLVSPWLQQLAADGFPGLPAPSIFEALQGPQAAPTVTPPSGPRGPKDKR
jgi:hypothetical protein